MKELELIAPASPRIAAVGVGYWGKNIARNLAQIGALSTVVDENDEVAQSVANEHRVSASTLTSVLADPSIDGLAIAVPAEAHFSVAMAGLLAGKHVFIEKPIALQVSDAESLTALAEERGLTLMVGHLLQYHNAYLTLKELVSAGRLGRMQYIYSNRLNFGKIRREEDILWSFAPHDISMIVGLVGEPIAVEAVAASYLDRHIADVTTTHLEFEGGVRGHIFVSWLHPYKEQKLVVVGERAMAVFDDSEPWADKLRVYDHVVDWHHQVPVANRADAVSIGLTESEPLRDEMTHFVECIATGSTPRTDGREATAVLRVLSAASIAIEPKEVDSPQHPDAPFVHPSSEVDNGATLGPRTKVWHYSHVLSETMIGADCSFGQNTMVGPRVTVGDRCRVQNGVSVFEGVTLADDVFCGPGMVFTNVTKPRAFIDQKDHFATTHVGRGATIGANATIVCGNDIGEYALVGAGAVVTTDVPAHALMLGVPARQAGWVSHGGEVLGADLVCPESSVRYEVRDACLRTVEED